MLERPEAGSNRYTRICSLRAASDSLSFQSVKSFPVLSFAKFLSGRLTAFATSSPSEPSTPTESWLYDTARPPIHRPSANPSTLWQRFCGTKSHMPEGEFGIGMSATQRFWSKPPGGVPDRTRTCDPQFRKLLLYPTELRGRRQTGYSSGVHFASSVMFVAARIAMGRESQNLRQRPRPSRPECLRG